MPEFKQRILQTELIDALIALPQMVGRDLCPPGVGIVRAEFASSRLWQPAENGQLLLVTGEFDGDEPIDIIAWRASEPRRWWFRTGHASVLGEDHLCACRFLGDPPIVRATPEAWCRAGGTGCVMLDGKFDRLKEFWPASTWMTPSSADGSDGHTASRRRICPKSGSGAGQ